MPGLLMVTTVPDTLEGFLLPFAEHFRRQGFRVDAMARGVSSRPACVRAFDQVWEMDWSRNPFSPANLFGGPQRVRKIVASQRYDLVHVHTPVAAFVTRFALRGLRAAGRTRVIYTAHGFHFYKGCPSLRAAAFRTLEKLAGNWTDYLVVINREDQEAAERSRLVAQGRVRFMPGIGVDTDLYHPDAISAGDITRVRSELNLTPQDRLFVMVAEFIPRKRHRDALQAFARLNRPDALLALAGSGPCVEEMRQLADKLGISARVRFLGFRKDIPTLIRAAACLLLPSEQEGLPRSILECLSLGVPAIGCRIRGVADLLEGGSGLLVPVGDVERLADALRQMLDHPDEARTMGERGRRLACDHDLRKIIRMHEALYEEALRPAWAQTAPRPATPTPMMLPTSPLEALA